MTELYPVKTRGCSPSISPACAIDCGLIGENNQAIILSLGICTLPFLLLYRHCLLCISSCVWYVTASKWAGNWPTRCYKCAHETDNRQNQETGLCSDRSLGPRGTPSRNIFLVLGIEPNTFCLLPLELYPPTLR
jgi:hypothetical protein